MAYASNTKLSGLAGIVGAAIGGYLGYTYAQAAGEPPIQGALVFGGIGLVAGSAGAFILKSAMQFLIYIILLLVIAYFFHDAIEGVTGVDPLDAVNNFLSRFGFTIPDIMAKAPAEPTP